MLHAWLLSSHQRFVPIDAMPHPMPSSTLNRFRDDDKKREAIVDTMGEIWETKIKSSPRLAEYAKSKGVTVNVLWGGAAYDYAFPTTQINAWQIHDGGKSKVSPDTVGIPRP